MRQLFQISCCHLNLIQVASPVPALNFHHCLGAEACSFCGMLQIKHTERAVRSAMEAAQISRPEDVHFVQIKCPLLTKERIAEAKSRGQTCATGIT